MSSHPSPLDALPPQERRRLLERAVPRSLAREQSLYLTGEPAERTHLLVEGIVKMLARDANGRATILCLGRPGDLLGEIPLLDGGLQPLDVVAATPAHVLSLEPVLLLDVLRRNPEAALAVAGALAARVRWLCGTALERSANDVPARLAGRLLELAEILGRMRGGTIEMDIPLAQEDLGRLAGMCRESACKALRSFQRQGVLDYRGRALRILRPDALERIRCGGRLRSET